MSQHLEHMVGQSVAVDGTARNAAGGAVVLTDDRTPVYVDGLMSWDKASDGKRVRVTGTLTKRGPDQVVTSHGERSHGFPDERFVLEQPTWTIS